MGNLRRWFESRIIAGVDPYYGPCYRRWFKWYGWSVGAKHVLPSEHTVPCWTNVPNAMWRNLLVIYNEARRDWQRRDFKSLWHIARFWR